MDARHLRYFLAVVDHGGFHRAAEALSVGQPTLTQAVAALERELRTALFHHVGADVVLTEAGRALVGPAREVGHGLEVARAAVEAVEGLRAGRVEIVATPSEAVSPLAGTIARFCAAYPQVRVVVRAAFTADEVITAVRSGATELGLLASARPIHATGLDLHPVARQRFVLVTAPESGLAGPVRPDQLEGRRLIGGPPATTMRSVVDGLERHGAVIAAECEHREAILPLVLAGVGMAVLPDSWRELAERAGARVVELEPPAHLDIAYVSRTGAVTAAARTFLEQATLRTHRPAPVDAC
ncbi:transcriptional regulator CynR [Pseudonocardia halophobica]|uniref:Transcriptional regulator CynR n=1 Tax=Pseudonocardia halophobica TaxID=29401 RepID=A0A9W6NYU9_9PSEU|nr:LysR substrate-binding domain-containing protein [Pseudonocardia halophobica]GLL14188.1 transcriptional regulator CynR [Pseudonocardia halophobica]